MLSVAARRMRGLRRLLAVALLSAHVVASAETPIPEPLRSPIPVPQIDARSWMLLDHDSGWVIGAREADLRIEPASLSKLMTAYVVFARIRDGAIALDDQVLVSEKAWRTGGSRMFIRVDTRVAVDDLLKGLIVQSGNDASVALAEHVAGSEEGFAQLMNETAERLGLSGTHFVNATGLPDPEHYSTARDLTILASALIRDFPELYRLYSVREFTWNDITQRNRNVLLGRDDSVDGVKTGHTSTAGYCLIGSARRDGRRLIATVIGTDSPKYRADAVYSLLQHGFAAYEGHRVYGAGDAVTQARVYKGAVSTVPAGFVDGLHVTVAQGRSGGLSARIGLDEPLIAPIRAGDRVGRLTLMVDGGEVADYSLVALDSVESGSWLGNLVDSVRLMLF